MFRIGCIRHSAIIPVVLVTSITSEVVEVLMSVLGTLVVSSGKEAAE